MNRAETLGPAGNGASSGPAMGADVSSQTGPESPSLVDQPGEVRDEDAFDAGRVADWLRAHAADPEGLTGTPQVRQFPGGASNLTYLLRFPQRDLILRRPPTGTKAKGAHDLAREHDLQAALAPVFPAVPAMVALCTDDEVLGATFYVMQRVPGLILRRDPPAGLDVDPVLAGGLAQSAIDTLVALHSVDPGSEQLSRFGRGPGYVARQVGGWSQRYRRARTPDVGDFEAVMAWLDARQVADRGTAVIHNDFRFDNLVLSPDDPMRVVGVLDWEMATVGDPLMDLGGALAYWVEAGDDEYFQDFRRQPSSAPGMWTRTEIVERYCDRMGFAMTPERWRFYEVFGLFRLAVIAQQIWYRYAHGQTTNPAYAVFGPAVGYLETRCRHLVTS